MNNLIINNRNIDGRNGVPIPSSINPPPVDPTPPEPPAPTYHSWLMALMSSLSNISNALNYQQAQDAGLLNQDQAYQKDIAEWWQTFISDYASRHSTDMSDPNKAPQVEANLNLYNTEMSTAGTTADGITHGMQSILNNDGNALAKMMDFLQQATEVVSFTANATRS